MPNLTLFITEADLAWMREHTGPGKPVSRADVLRRGIRQYRDGDRAPVDLSVFADLLRDYRHCAPDAAGKTDKWRLNLIARAEKALTKTGGSQ